MEILRSGSKSAGAMEFFSGAIGGVVVGANAFQSCAAAAKEFGAQGVINDAGSWFTIAAHELMLVAGSTVGKIGLTPKDWWIGEGYNYLTSANFSAIIAAGFGALAIKGVGDFARGVNDIGGRSR